MSLSQIAGAVATNWGMTDNNRTALRCREGRSSCLLHEEPRLLSCHRGCPALQKDCTDVVGSLCRLGRGLRSPRSQVPRILTLHHGVSRRLHDRAAWLGLYIHDAPSARSFRRRPLHAQRARGGRLLGPIFSLGSPRGVGVASRFALLVVVPRLLWLSLSI